MSIDELAEQQRKEREAKIRQDQHAAILEHQRTIVACKVWRCCINCDYFITRQRVINARTIEDRHCSKFNALPPPHIILHGCEHWDNDIPF